MSIRKSTSLLLLCIAPATAGLLSPAAAQQWVMPRTPAGHPDLQGNWTNVTITPFERQEGRSPVFTREEVDNLVGRAAGVIEAGARPSDPDRPPPTAGGSTGGYNNVYFDRAQRVAVVNGEYRTSLVTFPPDGRRPELTPEARRRAAERREFRSQFEEFDHPEIRSLAERCIVSFGTSAGPPMIPNNAYNSNYTIVQTADHVTIMTEMVHDVRIIRLGEPDPLPAHIRPWFGDSWGRWEGNTLVVETTNINPNHPFRGVPFSEDGKVTERLTRVDAETILYEFTVDDPTMYTQLWGGEIPFTQFNDLLYEYSCHEGNYALGNILSGARYQERQAGRN